MNQENRIPSNDLNYEKYLFLTLQKKVCSISSIRQIFKDSLFLSQFENTNEEQSSITPKRPLLSRDRTMDTCIDVSPLSDHNSRFEQSKHVFVPTTPLELTKNEQSTISIMENRMFIISPPSSIRSTALDEDEDENTCIPVFTQRKAKPAPSTTWKAPLPLPKSSSTLKTMIETSLPRLELPPSKFLSPPIQTTHFPLH